MGDSHFLQTAIVAAPIIILSLTVHEFFHAWSALKFGDDTAARMGRLTLNPLAHLDLMGFVVMVATSFRFGWAKPVPVNLFNTRNPRKADFWISFAGPLSNFGIAIILAIIFRLNGILNLAPGDSFINFATQTGVVINLVLGFFNLVPLFPLDGSHMLRSVLPDQYQESLARFESIAPFVLLGLIIVPNLIPGFPGLWIILGPLTNIIGGFLLY